MIVTFKFEDVRATKFTKITNDSLNSTIDSLPHTREKQILSQNLNRSQTPQCGFVVLCRDILAEETKTNFRTIYLHQDGVFS